MESRIDWFASTSIKRRMRRSNNCIEYRMLPVACGVSLTLDAFQSFDVVQCWVGLLQLGLLSTGVQPLRNIQTSAGLNRRVTQPRSQFFFFFFRNGTDFLVSVLMAEDNRKSVALLKCTPRRSSCAAAAGLSLPSFIARLGCP